LYNLGSILYYYLKTTDTEPKGMFSLQAASKISEIKSEVNKMRHQYIFSISLTVSNDDDDDQNISSDKLEVPSSSINYLSDSSSPQSKTIKDNSKESKRRSNRRSGSSKDDRGDKSGFFDWLSGGPSNVDNKNSTSDVKGKNVFLSCDSYADAELWVRSLETQIVALSDNIISGAIHQSNNNSNNFLIGSRRYSAPPEVRLQEVEDWMRSSKWKVCEVKEGLRIFEQSHENSNIDNHSLYFSQGIPQCRRVNIGLNGSPFDVFLAIMNLPPACRTGSINSIQVIEVVDNYTDIVHIVLDPVYLYPTWTSPRDLCLIRYWRHNSDGSYVVCWDSTFHQDCPVVTSYIRADIHAAYLICPPKYEEFDDIHVECMLSFIAEFDPKGWIWRSLGYQSKMLDNLMMYVLDIRDAVDNDRFIQAHLDTSNSNQNVYSSEPDAKVDESEVEGNIASAPTLPPEYWQDINASTFKVRGPTYIKDSIKAVSKPALFKLIAIDLFEVQENMQNISSHPQNRVALAAARGDDSFIFVMNIMIPGPPFYSIVIYLLADKKLIDEDSPFGRIARPFFYGNDDHERNNRFKLIPKIVEGNYAVKFAVKDTPTLLGNKITQTYFKGDNYFELDVDVSSSSVAR
jgi:hypothetical protein